MGLDCIAVRGQRAAVRHERAVGALVLESAVGRGGQVPGAFASAISAYAINPGTFDLLLVAGIGALGYFLRVWRANGAARAGGRWAT